MQRIASSAALVVLAAGLAAPAVYRAFTWAPIPAHIVGQVVNFNVPPTVIQGRVLLPLRGIFETTGSNMDYDARTQDTVALHGL